MTMQKLQRTRREMTE